MISTTPALSGFSPLRSVGVVRGLGLQTASILGRIGARLFGDKDTHRTSLREQARSEAHERMLKHAAALGANAIIGLRYEVLENDSAIEVLCYGTAIVAEPLAA